MTAAKSNGTHIGRPRDDDRLKKIWKMKDEGKSVVQIAKRYKCSRQNIYNALQKTA
jgi:Mor family transcriptional regulator